MVDVPSDPWALLFLPSWRLVTLAKLQLLLQASSHAGDLGLHVRNTRSEPWHWLPCLLLLPGMLECWAISQHRLHDLQSPHSIQHFSVQPSQGWEMQLNAIN